MNDIEFEKLLSHRPKISAGLGDSSPTLRDMVFNYYFDILRLDAERSATATKNYLDELHRSFIVPLQRNQARQGKAD